MVPESRTPAPKHIRVLVVDDSSFMRRSIKHILETDSAIEVIDTASEGEEAIRKTKQLKPDVVLLDIAMPVMDGLTALSHIMEEQPVPVLILSGVKDAKTAIKSLELGAVDFIKKPSGVISYDIENIKSEIIYKVKGVSGVNIKKFQMYYDAYRHKSGTAPPVSRGKEKEGKELIVIGASTGGPRAVVNILSGIPRDIRAGVLIVQHMAAEFVPSFVDRLQWVCHLDISIAAEGDVVQPGKVIVSAGGKNTTVVQEKNSRIIHVDEKSSPHGILPSVDAAMESVADLYREKTLGVLLTGMGRDGALGMKAIKDRGGETIAEDEATCVVYGMPKAAVELGVVDEVLPLPDIAEAIMNKLGSHHD